MALFQHPFLKLSHSSDGTSEICHPALDLSLITFYHALWMTFAICRPPGLSRVNRLLQGTQIPEHQCDPVNFIIDLVGAEVHLQLQLPEIAIK